jgi:hypothetical protein
LANLNASALAQLSLTVSKLAVLPQTSNYYAKSVIKESYLAMFIVLAGKLPGYDLNIVLLITNKQLLAVDNEYNQVYLTILWLWLNLAH